VNTGLFKTSSAETQKTASRIRKRPSASIITGSWSAVARDTGLSVPSGSVVQDLRKRMRRSLSAATTLKSTVCRNPVALFSQARVLSSSGW
jgi:hypothetical protein